MVQINCQDARTDVLDYVRLAFAIRQSADLRKRGGDFIVYEQSGGLLGGTLGGASIAAITVTDCEARADEGSVREQRLACVGVLG
jgi:hypothetical protein